MDLFLVFDTSVVLAAFLNPGGYSEKLIKLSGKLFFICTSKAIINETREKLLELKVSEYIIDSFLDSYLALSILCDKKSYKDSEVDNDDHLVGCLNNCKADLIVSLDYRRIKKLRQQNIPSIKPSELKKYFNAKIIKEFGL